MPLRPVPERPEPDYPDMEAFREDRRRFLQKLGAIAGAALAGQVLVGCGKEPPSRPAGTPPPQNPVQPPQPPVEQLPGGPAQPPVQPPEQLTGKIRAPEPPERLPGDIEPVQPPPKDGEKEPTPLPPKQGQEEPPQRLKGRIAQPLPKNADHK